DQPAHGRLTAATARALRDQTVVRGGITDVADPVEIAIRLIRIRDGRAVVLAVDDRVAVVIEALGDDRETTIDAAVVARRVARPPVVRHEYSSIVGWRRVFDDDQYAPLDGDVTALGHALVAAVRLARAPEVADRQRRAAGVAGRRREGRREVDLFA